MDTASTVREPLPSGPSSADAVHTLLAEWLVGQRWFPAKGSAGSVRPLAVLPLTDPDGAAEVQVRLLRLPSGSVLQVPVTLRADGDPGLPGTIGRAGGMLVVDGCHDPAFVRAWLTAARHETDDGPTAADAVGMRVLTGEQSNTSVLLPRARPPAILKVFRGLSEGPNPDVAVPLALSRVGWRGVPRPLAWLPASWPGPGVGDGAVGHLGVLSELVSGAQDGFELACDHAARGMDFGDLAEDLGRTTAQMHQALRTALPVAGGGAPDVVGVLRSRAAAAIDATEALAGRAEAVERVLAAVQQIPRLPPVQRVHGDYHLGQVLHSAVGWSVLDFEGEPQASAQERNRPDLALRDLAGMLRSLDYAAAVGGATSPDWSMQARRRLVRGYEAEAPGDVPGAPPADRRQTQVLLRALELDKALYEVVYESRNRPAWLRIPLDGVDRLLADAQADGGGR